jgi:predicted protein tyrosine phosphatase
MLDRLRTLLRPRLKVLFVCSQNRLRSRTAEEVFRDRAGLSVRSAGTLPDARVRIDEAMVSWADVVFGMEREHVDHVLGRFAEAAKGKTVVALDIPDDYDFMQRELVALLEAKVAPYLSEEQGRSGRR